MKKIVLVCCLFFVFAMSLWSKTHVSTQSHSGQINEIIVSNSDKELTSSIFTIGDDGFVINWTASGEGEHYQFSNDPLKMIAVSPINNYIAVYESNGSSVNKISVWDWNSATPVKKYQKKFTDTITSLKFSAKGTYLLVGTSSVKGVKVFNAKNGEELDKLNGNTGIVSFIQTSQTEKTALFYSPVGAVYYFNLTNGQQKRKLQVEKQLKQPVIYNNSLYLAGVKDNHIYIQNLNTGNIVKTIESADPIILSTENDKDLYYLEYAGRDNYRIKIVESLSAANVSSSRIVKSLKGPRNEGIISLGVKDSFNIYLGNKIGDIYKTNIEVTDSIVTLDQITENTYSKINEIAPADDVFYFLTETSIYKSSYDRSNIEKVASTKGETNITQYKDNQVILWSKDTKDAVMLYDLTNNTSKKLFTPSSYIQSLVINTVGTKDYIIDIEGYNSVNLYDISKKKLREVYSGTGVQDAVLTHDGNIYVAKSASTNPQYPLLCINMETLETVPVTEVNGNIVYGLSTDGTVIYGVKLVTTDDVVNTFVFSYHTLTKVAKDILKFPNEDADAFTYLNESYLFTNIGKDKIYCYNLDNKKFFSYGRSASIPKSMCKIKDRIVILNNNGSISWASTNNGSLITDWYLTVDEQWREF